MLSALDEILAAQLRCGQAAHAYIISGPQAAEQARALAAALLCPTPDADGSACGSCRSCCNVVAGTHPDLRWYVPAGGKGHKVEAMRELVGAAGLSPISGSRRVFVLEQAEAMSDEGANTLLKLLEEPAPSTTLILLTEHADALLPTILSRCQLFVLGRFATAEPQLPEGLAEQAQAFLRELPTLAAWQVLLRARDFEKDRPAQQQYFFALLQQLHQALLGRCDLPFDAPQLLRSANMVESALEMLSENVNQNLLSDVVFLRLWQNCRR